MTPESTHSRNLAARMGAEAGSELRQRGGPTFFHAA